MPPKASDDEIDALKKELLTLTEKCREQQKKAMDSQDFGPFTPLPKAARAVTRRNLRGHINKVTCCHFSGDSRHVVSGSLDGKLIVWDCWSGNKTMVIPLRSAWVMTAVFSPSGCLIGSGGMDNMLTIYDANNRDSSGVAKIVREFLGYEGFLSSCRFLDDEKVVSGSGDAKIVEWDVKTGQKLKSLSGHNGDVTSLSLRPDGNVFASCSVDRTARLWDLRTEIGCQQTFWGHAADVNCVSFHPGGNHLVTCSEDKSARLWDLRADQEVALYKTPSSNSSLTSCALSSSGRVLFCGSDDGSVHTWDLLSRAHHGGLCGHENRVTQVSVAPSGIAIASASWDCSVRVWAL